MTVQEIPPLSPVRTAPSSDSQPRQNYQSSRPVSAVVVGAGIAGIATAVLLQAKVPNLQLTVIERHSRVGGTWQENHYPGVRCDIASHCYQLSFEPNPNWTEFYARGPEIRQYYEDVCKKYGIDKITRFSTEVLEAKWSEDTSKWTLDTKNLITGNEEQLMVDFVISATGKLNTATLPNIAGLSSFQGAVTHTANWDDSLDLTDKRVAVIGNGASGMQILPAILPQTRQLVHFARTPNWVSTAFNKLLAPLAATRDAPGGHQFSAAERREFTAQPHVYLEYRKRISVAFHQAFDAFYLGSAASDEYRRHLTENITQRAAADAELVPRLVPDYAPGCKRMTPGPGYIEALLDPKVDYVTTPISHVTGTSIVTTAGSEHPVDVIVAATGFPERSFPVFPVHGRAGALLSTQWGRSGPVGYPKSYFGVMTPNFPNYFFVAAAQGTAIGGTVPLHNEHTATYIAKCIRKMQAQQYASLEPSQDATDDFDQVVNAFFKDKATSDTCSSWWKQGKGPARVLNLWPGSGHHKWDTSREPRWEDFVFTRSPETRQNRFAYFQSGWTEKEARGDADELTAYLEEVGKIDLKTLHESWTQGY